MATELKVRVKLAARCLVDGVIREKDEIVELPELIADSFGEVQGKKQAANSGQQSEKAES